MDLKQMQKFNQKMGRYKGGGLIKRIGDRHYFDSGGSVNPATGAPAPAPIPLNSVNPNTTLTSGNAITNQNAVNPNTGIAGTIGNALGVNDQFQAGTANIQAGTNAGQLNTAYTGANNAINAQTGVANALTPGVAAGANTQANAANVLTGVANGTGPNPAQAALNQNTAQNIAQQAALAANVRGAGTNAGLIASQNAQTGAGIQQQAVAQAAANQAAQQIAAANTAAGIGAQQVGQGLTATTGLNTVQQGEQGILQNANASYNNAGVGMQSNINNVNAATAQANQQANMGIIGGLFSGLSSIPGVGGALGSVGKTLSGIFAHGGEVHMMKGGKRCAGPHQSHVANFLAKGGEAKSSDVPAMVSPGERYLNPEEVKKVIHEGANPMRMGKVFLGKPKVKGDSLKNDTISTELEEGGVVIPRHVETKKDPEKSSLFVHRAVHMKRPNKAA